MSNGASTSGARTVSKPNGIASSARARSSPRMTGISGIRVDWSGSGLPTVNQAELASPYGEKGQILAAALVAIQRAEGEAEKAGPRA